jgi:glucose dehydrogenase
MGTTDARLIAIDARTGQRCAGFGGGGEIDLLEGLRDVEPQEYKVNSPPTLIGVSDSLWQKVWGRSRDILEHHP